MSNLEMFAFPTRFYQAYYAGQSLEPRNMSNENERSNEAVASEATSDTQPVRVTLPPGHFYSPIVDPSQINPQRVWPAQPDIIGIEFNDANHERLLKEVFPKYLRDYDYPEHLDEKGDLADFFTQNSQFSWLDSRSYFVFLREWRPKRLVEVGSGFSTLLAADVNRRFLNDALSITCIEPFPREFLKRGISGVSHLIERKVQDVSLDEFTALKAGDMLFIDSSHVAKTDSDVNFLFFEVMPRLASGVYIHLHDVFLPHDYSQEWVIAENRSWNEQYLLRALLMYSTAFTIEFGCNYAYTRYPELVRDVLSNGHAYGGGSIWIRRQ